MGKLTLYAKWRPEMDADTYILVKYDADGGTVNGEAIYDDPLHYAALPLEAVAQPKRSPASDEAGKSQSLADPGTQLMKSRRGPPRKHLQREPG